MTVVTDDILAVYNINYVSLCKANFPKKIAITYAV
jgi:hypothetical protein